MALSVNSTWDNELWLSGILNWRWRGKLIRTRRLTLKGICIDKLYRDNGLNSELGLNLNPHTINIQEDLNKPRETQNKNNQHLTLLLASKIHM